MSAVGALLSLSAGNLLREIRSFRQGTRPEDRTPLLEGGSQWRDIELDDLAPRDAGADEDEAASPDPNTHRLDISPFKLKFLQENSDAKKMLIKSLVDKGFSTVFDWNTRSVKLTPIDGDADETKEALKHIDKSVFEMDLCKEQLDLMENMEMDISAGLLIPDVICVLFVKIGEDLKLLGLQQDIATVSAVLETSMTKTQVEQKKEFTICDTTYDYLRNYRWQHIEPKLNQSETDVEWRKEPYSLILRGKSPAFEEARAIIKQEIESVTKFNVVLEPGMNMAVVSQVVEEVRTKRQCSIIYQQGHREAATHDSQSTTLTVRGNKITNIDVVTNSIEKQKADIIVNTTNEELDLSRGQGVSWSILQAAGPSIQDELKRTYQTGIKHGEVAESGPGNLKTCRTIFHGALPEFPEKNDTIAEENCYKWLISLVFHCLIKASSSTRGFRSIAFPALGTGALNFPVQHVVQLMYRAIKLYNEEHPHPPIKDVFLVIFQDTKLEVKQLFLAHKVTHHLKTRHVGSLVDMHKEKRHLNTKTPQYEIRAQIGDTLLQVVHGDIQSCCDVADAVLVMWPQTDIQASAHPGLTCTNRGKKDWKCSTFLKELPQAKSTADSTNLPGKTLIHAYCKESAGSPAVDAVVKGITTAAKLKCTTLVVTLPNDGQHATEPRNLAEVVHTAIKKTQSKLYLLTVVIEEEMAFTAFVEKLSSMNSKFLPPASVDKTPLARELWQDTFSDHAASTIKSYKAIVAETTGDSVLLVTSNSGETIREATDDIKRLLNEKLQQTVQETVRGING